MSDQVILGLILLARPIVYCGATLLFILFLWRMTGRSPLAMGLEFIGEFLDLLRAVRSLKSLNALIFILAFVVIFVVFVTPLHDFLLPELVSNEQASRELAEKGMIALLTCFFLGSGLFCVWICSYAPAEQGSTRARRDTH